MGKHFQLETIDPRNLPHGRAVVTIPYTLILHFFKYWPVRYENLRAAKEVLENPKRIFAGIRAHNEGGWCFTGRPKEWHIGEHVVEPFPENLVFAVYLNSRLWVFDCVAEPAADDDSLCPRNWQDRYGGLIWKSTS